MCDPVNRWWVDYGLRWQGVISRCAHENTLYPEDTQKQKTHTLPSPGPVLIQTAVFIVDICSGRRCSLPWHAAPLLCPVLAGRRLGSALVEQRLAPAPRPSVAALGVYDTFYRRFYFRFLLYFEVQFTRTELPGLLCNSLFFFTALLLSLALSFRVKTATLFSEHSLAKKTLALRKNMQLWYHGKWPHICQNNISWRFNNNCISWWYRCIL